MHNLISSDILLNQWKSSPQRINHPYQPLDFLPTLCGSSIKHSLLSPAGIHWSASPHLNQFSCSRIVYEWNHTVDTHFCVIQFCDCMYLHSLLTLKKFHCTDTQQLFFSPFSCWWMHGLFLGVCY